MGPESVSVVTDAGPIIHLAEIDCLHLLAVFSELHIPTVVWQEILRHVRESLLDFPDILIVQQHSIARKKLEEYIAAHKLEHLHAGEQACFPLCATLHVSNLLTDDLAVRKAAKTLKLTPIGSLGVLVRAFQTGMLKLSETERKMLELQQKSSLFVTRAIVELAIEQLRK